MEMELGLAGRQSEGNGLIRYLRSRMELQPDGAISFYEYMKHCLYHPDWGYYTSERVKIGKEGDFYTSASIGGLMGEMLAEWIMKQWADAGMKEPLTLIEWGGGSGKLAKDVLDAIRSGSPECYERVRYIGVETSEYHRRLQRETLAEHAGRVRLLSVEEWRREGPWSHAVLWSNELLDAMPVHRLRYREGLGWEEIAVGWDEESHWFRERLRPLKDPEVLGYVAREAVPERDGQTIEVNTDAVSWLAGVAERMESGWVLTVDYGDVSREIYGPHRIAGTLMCYRKHLASAAPYEFPGEQDMTAHVNFSALLHAGEAAGVTESRLLTQKQFLVEQGLLSKLQDHDAADPFSPAARRNRAIRQLLLSDQMSELFKVLIQKKGDPR
ncbi:SAM-dependent methyltransferase [Paenibacillus filicis]|uniref:SAM-dependent methyltransferase n=1 Tax=Paenibacillus gyeongsangnamensis TaxID=3388067 RepID=A0ABT4Q2V8_9BACL|nr:SAM-dependent methyltransferase [Paenibacillus filicis]MCZ8511209.1 SAM-dependent methyltransferase [Paenibacillus filicis]